MAITRVHSATAQSQTVGLGTSQVGDLAIFQYVYSSGVLYDPPAGSTIIRRGAYQFSTLGVLTAYKFLDNADITAGTITVTPATDVRPGTHQIAVYRNVDTSQFVNRAYVQGDSDANHVHDAITPTKDNAFIISLMSGKANDVLTRTLTPAAGFTQITYGNYDVTASVRVHGWISEATPAGTGGVAYPSFTMTTDTGLFVACDTVALNPTVAGSVPNGWVEVRLFTPDPPPP